MGAALLKVRLTRSLPDGRLMGDVIFCRRVQGQGGRGWLADRGTQAPGGGCRAEADQLLSRMEEHFQVIVNTVGVTT